MSIPAIFIRRPVATTLLTLAILLSGFLAFFLLPVAPLPNIAFPTIVVQTQMAGASPATMASTVAEPLERHLGAIADVTQLTSESDLGLTRITVQFGLDRDINGAARDVEAAIQAARADLPSTLRNNPNYAKYNPAAAPIMVLTLTSRTLTPAQLYDSANTVIEQQLSQIDGVGTVEIGGGALPAVRVALRPGPLSRYGIGLEDVRAAVSAANADSPKGSVNQDGERFQIYSNDQATRAKDYRDLVIAYRAGAPVYLHDVATIQDSVEDVYNAGIFDDRQAILVIVHPSPNANVIKTVNEIRRVLPRIEEALPKDAQVGVALDRSQSVHGAATDTERALFAAVLLVIGVVFVFLRSVRAVLVPAVTLPVCIIGAFGPMYLLGYSLDDLSLMSLTIATGFVVDDAVVVLENITRHIEAGLAPHEAAIRGAGEVAFTVVSMSLSLIAVFLPILLMPGLVGRLFHEFAVTLSIAILISLLLSLTTTPAICALVLKREQRRTGRRAGTSLFERVKGWYGDSLTATLDHARLVSLGLLALIVLNLFLFRAVPKTFFPEQDTGVLIGTVQADQSISFQAMRSKLTQLLNIVGHNPAVATAAGYIGGRATNSGFIFVSLKPLSVRKISAARIVARLRPELQRIAGAQLYLVPAQDLTVGARQTAAEYQYTLTGDDPGTLYAWALRLVTALRKSPNLNDVNSDVQQGGRETEVHIDRSTASRLGLTPSEIDATLYDAFGQRTASTIYNPFNEYYVVMELEPRYQETPQSLRDIYVSTVGGTPSGTASTQMLPGTISGVPTASSSSSSSTSAASAQNQATNSIANTGKGSASSGAAVSTGAETMVPLAAFTTLSSGTTPISVSHQGGLVAATISFDLPLGISLSEATQAIEKTMHSLNMPISIRGNFAGTAQAFAASLATEPLLIAAALGAVYVVLGILYESTIHPITILSTIPSAGIGATLALLLLGTPFSIIALIGVILLIGIVKKNAILMIDFALQLQRREGLAPKEAIHRAAVLRLRPILMTTFAAVLGAVPLAIGFGQGGSLRQPLGVTIVGGLILSQILTLYTTPAVYLILDRLGTRLRGTAGDALPRGTLPGRGRGQEIPL